MTVARSRVPEAGIPAPLSLPRPERRHLANGMVVASVRRGRLPEATLSLVLPAGAGSTGVDRAGLASLVAKVLPEGAAGHDARQMAEWLDGLGVRLGVTVGYDSMVLRLHTLSELLPAALEALVAVAVQPEFLEVEVSRCRDERLDAIRRARDEPADVAADVLCELLYGDHPYGRLTRGREGTIACMSRDDLVRFHARCFVPGAATLVACGDLPADFDRLVVEGFGGWEGGTVARGVDETVERALQPGIHLVDRPGSAQSEIRIAAVGLPRGGSDEPAARVANAILGGLFNSRLNMNLREDKGWTYGARSGLSLRRYRGPVTLRAAVESRWTGPAVREMLAEVDRLRESPPLEAEMRTAGGALTRSLPLRFETNGQIARSLVEQVVYGLPDDYWDTFGSRIEGVEPEQVREIVARLLNPADLVVLVVGDAEAVLAGLEEAGPVALREAP